MLNQKYYQRLYNLKQLWNFRFSNRFEIVNLFHLILLCIRMDLCWKSSLKWQQPLRKTNSFIHWIRITSSVGFSKIQKDLKNAHRYAVLPTKEINQDPSFCKAYHAREKGDTQIYSKFSILIKFISYKANLKLTSIH